MTQRAGVITMLGAAALGAAFFVWIAGVRIITPTEVAWTMQSDWRIHFLGWHVFRSEPWHLPLGRIDSYFQPLGTAVGFTDSIPIAAFLLKPFSPLLPAAFQYLGPWLLLCYMLQGVFAVLLMRLWTSSAILQLLGTACFILVPTLLMRVGHPALCSHWLLLWALWLYLRADRLPRAPFAQSAAVALIAGMVHPYLALMVTGLLGALGLRLVIARRMSGVAVGAVAVCAMAAGWWLSGLFTVSGSENLASEGFTKYSTNLLALITPTGWSMFLPEVPIGAEGQLWEGFHYLGLGLILLTLGAAVARRVLPGERHTTALWPLIVVVMLMAIYSLSPRVTFGSLVVAEIDSAFIERLAIFRATGRFFWPAGYLLLTMALAVIVSRLPARAATAVLCAVVAVQLVDLRGAHAARRQTSRSEGFHAWTPSLASPAWDRLLPAYKHMIVYPPSYCGRSAPADLESLSYLAGLHHLTLNSGFVARFDESHRRAACREIADAVLRGEVDDSRLYLGRPGEIDQLKQYAKQPMVCGVIDAVGVCATARSYQQWRDVVHLE